MDEQGEVGVGDLTQLPSTWAVATLPDVTSSVGGGTPPKADPAYWLNGTVPWISPKDMKIFSLVGSEDLVTEKALDRLSVVPEGSVLVVVRSGILSRTFPVALNAVPVTINQDMRAFIPERNVSARYLALQMIAKERDILSTCSKNGTTVASIEGPSLTRFPLALAPSAEQTRIVDKLEELLSDLDAGVAELKAAQKKLGQYRQSLLKAAVEGALTAEWREARKSVRPEPFDSAQDRLVEGPDMVSYSSIHPSTGSGRTDEYATGAQLLQRILTERRARWETKQLAKFAEQGKTPPNDWQKKYPEPVQPDTTDLPELPEGWVWASVDQLSESVRNGLSMTPNTVGRGFPIFKINAVRPMAVNFNAIKHIEIDECEAADYWVEPGDVLATRYNGSVDLLGVFGMVKDVPVRTLHPDKLIRMKPVTGVQLGAWMEVCGNVGLSRKHLVSRVKTTAGQTGISGDDLKKTPIPLPPDTEQESALAVLEERLQAVKDLELPTELSLKQSTAQRQNILRAAFSGQLVPQDPNDEPASALLARIRAERAERDAVKKPRGRKTKEVV
jgi:type I restriction enzyme S subunit